MQLKKFTAVPAPVYPLKGEQWTRLNINAHIDYLISTKGRIYSQWAGRIITGRISNGVRTLDYSPLNKKDMPVNAFTGKARKSRRKGRVVVTYQQLVARTFLPKVAGKNLVLHINYDPFDNRVENLKWATKAECMKSSNASPYYIRSQTPGSKLSFDDVDRLRSMLRAKQKGYVRITMKEIAEQFGITVTHLYRVQNGTTFGKYGKPVKPKKVVKLITEKQARQMKALAAKGLSGLKIGKQLGVSPSSVYRVLTGVAFPKLTSD